MTLPQLAGDRVFVGAAGLETAPIVNQETEPPAFAGFAPLDGALLGRERECAALDRLLDASARGRAARSCCAVRPGRARRRC